MHSNNSTLNISTETGRLTPRCKVSCEAPVFTVRGRKRCNSVIKGNFTAVIRFRGHILRTGRTKTSFVGVVAAKVLSFGRRKTVAKAPLSKSRMGRVMRVTRRRNVTIVSRAGKSCKMRTTITTKISDLRRKGCVGRRDLTVLTRDSAI